MLATIPVFFFVCWIRGAIICYELHTDSRIKIDKWDRRRVLKIAAICMAICMFTIATVLGIYSDKSKQAEAHIYPGSIIDVTVYINDTRATYCILALLCLFVACFALSWGPIGWIYPAEIYPQLIRAKAMGVTTASSYCFNVAISQIAPVLFRYITWGTYVVFGCSCMIIAWIVHAYYPETRVSF